MLNRGCELRRELALLLDALQDRRAPLLEFAQVGEPLFEQAQLRVIKTSGGFLAIAGDEGHGGLAIQQGDGGLDLRQACVDLFSDALSDGCHEEVRRSFYLTAPVCANLPLVRQLISLAILCGLAVTTANAQPAPARPNIVLIITDDVGYGDIGSYGAPDIKTPNIDSLAKAGMRFTQFYANGSTCTPTRAGLISGRYQQRVRAGASAERARQPRRRARTAGDGTIAAATAEATTATRPALIGKWHLGYLPQFSPKAHGFDSFFGFKSGYIDYYQHTDGVGQPDLFENDDPIKADGYMTDLITERSVTFIDDARAVAVLPRGRLQRRALAVSGSRSAVDGDRQRAPRDAVRREPRHARRLRQDHGARRSGRRPDPRGARPARASPPTRW